MQAALWLRHAWVPCGQRPNAATVPGGAPTTTTTAGHPPRATTHSHASWHARLISTHAFCADTQGERHAVCIAPGARKEGNRTRLQTRRDFQICTHQAPTTSSCALDRGNGRDAHMPTSVINIRYVSLKNRHFADVGHEPSPAGPSLGAQGSSLSSWHIAAMDASIRGVPRHTIAFRICMGADCGRAAVCPDP
jgi:hypothetical protein